MGVAAMRTARKLPVEELQSQPPKGSKPLSLFEDDDEFGFQPSQGSMPALFEDIPEDFPQTDQPEESHTQSSSATLDYDAQNTAEFAVEDESQFNRELLEAEEILTSNYQQLPTAESRFAQTKPGGSLTTTTDSAAIPEILAYLDEHLEDFLSSPPQPTRDSVNDKDEFDIPSDTQVARDISSSPPHFPSTMSEAQSRPTNTIVYSETEGLTSLLSSQYLNISSQDVRDIESPIQPLASDGEYETVRSPSVETDGSAPTAVLGKIARKRKYSEKWFH